MGSADLLLRGRITHPFVFALAALIAAPVVRIIAKMICTNRDDFLDCVNACRRSLWLSLLRGEAENLHIQVFSVVLFVLSSRLVTAAFCKAPLVLAGMLHGSLSRTLC